MCPYRAVITPDGRGVGNAQVVLTDPQGETRTVIAGRGGAFNFDDVPTGSAYTVAVTSQRFTFEPQVITVTDPVTGLSFRAQR